jgi:ribosomal-protein-alanine N-acetyltransferase
MRSGSERDYFLNTERLKFSRWRKEDLALAMVLWGDTRVTAFIGGPFSPDQVAARLDREIESLRTNQIQYWPVFLSGTGDFTGCAGLHPYGEDKQVLELGFHFRPEYWGQGLVQEAARAVIAFAFQTLTVTSLFAGHHPENEPSERLIRRLGFLYTHEELYPPSGLMEPCYRLTNPAATQNRPQSL